eukprot:m.457646 g.457646  ORF g.457646 m.457646 type:complete len:545 (-) comp20334_c0_seq1:49-1683(-)
MALDVGGGGGTGIQDAGSDRTPLLSSSQEPKPQPSKAFLIVLSLFAAVGGFLFGYDTGVVSGAMLLLKKQFDLTDFQQELVVAITIALSIVSAAASGPCNDYFGRRPVIMFGAAAFTAGAIVLAVAQTWIQLLIGRAILGAGLGCASSTVPLYLAETAPAEMRGTLTVLSNLFITGGQFVAGLVDGAFAEVHEGWRYMLGLAALPAVIQLVGFLFLPESPRWLVSKGKVARAEKILRRIRGGASVEQEMDDIKRSFDNAPKVQLSDVFRDRWLRKALIVGCGLQLFQQLSGINTVMYYSATIVKQAGSASDSEAIWISAGIAGGNFIFTLVGMALVDRGGRRFLLLGSLAGVVVSLGVLGAAFHIGDASAPAVDLQHSDAMCQMATCSSCSAAKHCGYCAVPLAATGSPLGVCLAGNSSVVPSGCADSKQWMFDYCPNSLAWLAIGSLVLYIVMFAPGMGPMPWTVNSEIYPPQYRSLGNSAATAVNWTGNLVISLTFLTLCNVLTTAGAFWLYCGLAVLAWLFVYFMVPETKGKTLEEIRDLF